MTIVLSAPDRDRTTPGVRSLSTLVRGHSCSMSSTLSRRDSATRREEFATAPRTSTTRTPRPRHNVQPGHSLETSDEISRGDSHFYAVHRLHRAIDKTETFRTSPSHPIFPNSPFDLGRFSKGHLFMNRDSKQTCRFFFLHSYYFRILGQTSFSDFRSSFATASTSLCCLGRQSRHYSHNVTYSPLSSTA